MKRTLSIPLIVVLAACQPEQQVDETYTGETFGRIAGFVTDIDGNGLDGVQVETQDMVVVTDADGRFALDGILPAEDIVLEYSLDGYAKSYSTTTVMSWETANTNAKLMQVDGYATFDGALGGTIAVEDVSVTFQANGVVDADGNPYTGTVTAAITHVDPYTTELAGAPGDLQALAFDPSGTSKDAVRASQLISYGMVDVTLKGADGEELNVEESSPAAVRMPITNPEGFGEQVRLDAGDRMNTWSFDRERGRWVEEGMGEVSEEDGKLVFDFEATHFSWWNCDQGNPPSCATGRVVDYLGFPVRGAEITCAGRLSTSRTTTDEEGYYVCNVLVGDTVTFSGLTHVAQRNWAKSIPNVFLYGYGSSAADCQPIPTIDIPVCRVTGAVTVENLDSVVDDQRKSNSGDHVSAAFFAPKGDIEYCDNPWDAVPEGQCAVFDTTNASDFFPSSAQTGLFSDSRSVGSYMEVATSRQSYILNQQVLESNKFYEVTVHDTDNSGKLTTDRPDFQGGDALSVSAPGAATDYLGPWSESRLGFVPGDLTWTNPETLTQSRSSSMSLNYSGATNDPRGVLVLGTQASGSEAMMCRFADNGSANVPSSALSQLDSGYGGIGIYHVDDSYAVGPDGMPIRLQMFSGVTTSIDLN